MKFEVWIFLSLFSIFSLDLTSQDQHFSQFYAAPLNLNPALAGAYDGSFRVGAIYRDQWRSALDNPISTYAVGGDLRYALTFLDKKNPDYASIGFQFYGDRAALYDLNTNQISLFFAYHKALDKATRQYLSAGFQMGIAQKNINYEKLVFGDQFNNLDAYDQPTGEEFPINNFAYGDYGLGIHYTVRPSSFFNLNTGFSASHFHTPNISFYRSNEDINPDLDKENNLPVKYSAYVNTTFDISNQFALSPRLLFLSQGSHMELNTGVNFSIKRDAFARDRLNFGAFLRPVRDTEKITLDALILIAGFEYSNMLIGMSYDLSLRDLVTDRIGVGVFEISLTYIGDYENDFTFCPQF